MPHNTLSSVSDVQIEELERENSRLFAEVSRLSEVNRQLLTRTSSGLSSRSRLKFVQRVFRFEPTSTALFKLHKYSLEGREQWYQSRLVHALGHLTVVDDTTVSALYTHLLSFARGANSLAGLESLFLTCMHTMWTTRQIDLYKTGIEAWRACSRSKQKPQSKDGGIVFFDRSTNLITFVPWRQADLLSDKLLSEGFFGPHGIAGAIRDPRGYADDNRFGFGYSKCLATCVGTVTVSSGIGGALGGFSSPIPGGTAGGLKFGLEFGAIFGGVSCAWLCEDDQKPPPPPDKNKNNDSTNNSPPPSPDASATPPDGGTTSSEPSSSGNTETPTEKEEEQQQSLPEEHPNQSTDSCDNCSSLSSGTYPVPDGPDDPGSPYSPLANLVEIISFPTEDGEPGGPAGRTTSMGTARTFLLRGMPRLSAGNNLLAVPGILKDAGLGFH